MLVAIENVIEGHQLYLSVLSETGLLVRGEGIIKGHGLSPMLQLPPIPTGNTVGDHYTGPLGTPSETGNTVVDLDLPLCVLGGTTLYVLGLRFIRSPPLPLGGCATDRLSIILSTPWQSPGHTPGNLSRSYNISTMERITGLRLIIAHYVNQIHYAGPVNTYT